MPDGTARSAVEMTADRAFRSLVVRLSAVSAVALGVIAAFAARATAVGAGPRRLLVVGWVLMPTVLLASLRDPRLRYALALPATLVTVALVAVSADVLASRNPVVVGWMLVTSGVLMGNVLGAWFWFRLLPVPPSLNDPLSRGRRTLVVIHASLVVSGLLLVGSGPPHTAI